MTGRKQLDDLIEDLPHLTAGLNNAIQAKKRLQYELEKYRSYRAMDLENKETLMEQTRKNYQEARSVGTRHRTD